MVIFGRRTGHYATESAIPLLIISTGTPCQPPRLDGVSPFPPERRTTSRSAAITRSHQSPGPTRAPCWRSATVLEFAGPPREQPARRWRDTAPRAAARRGRRAGHRRPPWGRNAPRLDTVPPVARRDAWSRGCDASAGTIQEGWQRCGGAGAARRDRPWLLAPARPEPRAGCRRRRHRLLRHRERGEGEGTPQAPGQGEERRAGRQGRGDTESPQRARFAIRHAELAHQHATRVAADPAGRRRHHARWLPHQRLAQRHQPAGAHAAADDHDPAGHQPGRHAPGGAGQVGGSAVGRQVGQAQHPRHGRPRPDRRRCQGLRRRDRQGRRRGGQGRDPQVDPQQHPADRPPAHRHRGNPQERVPQQRPADGHRVQRADRLAACSPRTWRRPRPARR